MERRRFIKHLGVGLPAIASSVARGQESNESPTPTLYYVDGYHGGIRGHMPRGAWRDILNTLREASHWKLCLDIEPLSWEVLRREDPEAFRELKTYLDRQPLDARIEMAGATFSQPYGWVIGGESNIRQLLRGREIIRAHFPKAVVETYAVQEPCWASSMPQILRSLGFTAAVLKNPSTAWAGYAAGFDAELVNWVGSDGSSIPAVPRYACEELVKVWETESVSGSREFSRKCASRGIPHPAGMCFQDLGWAAKPKVKGDHIRFVTWREYIHSVAEKPARSWRFGIEDILTALPWGETTLQSVAQQVRSAENRMLIAEKMAAMAWLGGRGIWPVSELRAAWDELMWAQHHDAWIVSSGREGRQAWAFQAAAQTLNAEGSASQIVADSAEFLSRGQHGAVRQSPGTQWFRVFNSLAVKRDEVTELPLDTDRGTQGVRVFDASGREVVCQAVPTRRYRSREAPDAKETVNSALVLFRAQIPALGFATYRVEPVYDAQPASSQEPVRAALESDGNVTLENELYRLVLDPRRGGAITSLYAKTLKKEFCDASAERLFNEYRGYFISQERWRSSTETAAEVKLLESGPVRARVQFAGNVGGVPCQTIISLAEGQRRIEFQVSFRYEQETWIGDPFDLKPMLPGIGWSENRRSPFDGRSKLQALFPVSLRNHAVYKNAAYDVCRSRHANTYFQRWDEIKHNIIVNWVDLVDERENYGLAVLSDHTTGYTHGPDHPLALVLGWGWSGGCVQRKCPLKGPRQMKYAVVPHTGIWNEARLSEENARWVEPPITQLMDGGPPDGSGTRSFLAISGTGIEVPTMLSDGSRLLVRLFNAEGDETERIISLDARLRRAELVELDGRSVRQLPMRTASDGRREIRLAIPRFGLRTLRCELEFNKT